MIEIGLILAINVAGLAFAVTLARWVKNRDPGSAESRRLMAAIRRAADQFLWSEHRLTALGAAGLGVLIFIVHGALSRGGSPAASLESAFWTVLAVVAGAALASLAAHFAERRTLEASPRTVAAAGISMDRALGIALRSSGAAAIAAQALSTLGVLGFFALVYTMKGGLGLAPAEAAALAARVASLLPGFAVGAAGAALVLQRAGAAFRVASRIGADTAGERDAGLERDDPRNPAVVADFVGDHVGHAAVRVADLFVSCAVASVATVALATRLLAKSPDAPARMLALVVLPLAVHAFGVIASAFGVMAVRTDEPSSIDAAFRRGAATTGLVTLGALAGTSFWLLGDQHWARFFAAGALGLAGTGAVAYAARYRAIRRFTPLRDVLESLRMGEPGPIGYGLGSGLAAALVPILVAGAATVVAWRLGDGSGLESGGLVASVTMLMAALAASPFVLALGALAPIADNARGVATMTLGPGAADADKRTARLDDAGVGAAAMAEPYLIISGSASALLVAGALALGLVEQTRGFASVAAPALAWSAALGAAVVLAYAGSAARAAMRGARAVALEVERQLRGFPREHGIARVPREYTPSYRTCIELTTRTALEGVLPPVSLAALVPALVAGALVLATRSAHDGVAASSLTAFAVTSTITGLAVALVADGLRCTLVAARRAARPRGSVSGFSASVSGGVIAELAGHAIGPAAHLLIKLTAVACLLAAPFVS
ncbi:MAG: sodium/proton-translocating pyrophosphatase [Sorangiineae bacterium]|nr:sodium/proton-translocating pyrophosphatase [Polyangiaceae bacterium]MEB2321397.1 sodium/proton-translocating pyrophosphatase [Sorangiineae bacterium]